MAANFQQHMGGPGQMMPQQQQQRQQQPRPPTNVTAMSAVQQMILSTLNTQAQNFTGWQAQVLIQERMGLIFNIIGNLRLASQHQPNPPNLHKMVDIAIRFEREIFEKSPDKAAYKRAVDTKLEQLLERRNQNQAGLQQSIQQQAQAQAQAQQAHAQQMMMNQNNMQGQVQRNMPQQPAQQGFQHLQHQMQASPIPGQHPQQMPMGMPNEGLPQNMPPTPQQQFQMQHMQQPQARPPQQSIPGRPQNVQGNQLSPQENELLGEWTQTLMAQATTEDKNNIRNTLQGRIDPAQLQRYNAQNFDIAVLYFRNQALNKLKQSRSQAHAQQQALGIPQVQNMPGGATMQPSRSMNPSPLNGQVPPPSSIGGDGNFMGSSMENIAVQQQQQGVMAQNEGQMVVPASNAPRNATPQPGNMPGPTMNVNDQRANPNPRAQQQQQMFNAHQVRQQQLQHAAQQQQQQSQARLNAQAKAQMGLQGQPGGMGPGPVPPQQSPAMATLNAPLRTPSQQMNHPEPPPTNPTAQFGQPLDPRFMQGNQRQMGPNNVMNIAGLNPAMVASMPQEQQQRLASLPPEKLNEMVAKWNEQRAQQMNPQGLRPGMPMQGTQIRPGQQVPPPGQFNPQTTAIQQFVSANPGRPLPPAMAAGMTPQQQMMLQQQMQRMQQQSQNQLQQRNGQQVLTPNEQRTVSQMDHMDYPPNLINHPKMPQGIPMDLKKWGQLKQWVHQNPNSGPGAMENIKGLQKLHYQQILRAKQQQIGPPGMMQPGPQGGQVGMPVVPPGMAAPVAHMGQNPMQNPMRPQPIPPPTQEEIQNARNHPKMTQATDDQIRNFLARHHIGMNPQQQQQRTQQLMALQMNRMPQTNGQQGRPGQQQPNPMALNQQMPVQTPQPKQSQPVPEPPTQPAAPNATRQARPQQNARNAAQNSSPAQPPKNLKRASSDDVIEVPNPNTQQPRSTPQQAQGSSQAPQQGPRTLTPQQVASLDPESRKKYENILRAQQARQQTQLSPADIQRLRVIAQEESKRPREPDVPMDQETKATAASMLQAIVAPLSNVHKAVPRWFQITHDEPRARTFFRAKHRIQAQFKDQEMKQIKDVFSMRPSDIEGARLMLSTMVKDLSERFPSMIKPETAQPQAAAAPPATRPPGPSAPLNAANLQQQQRELNKEHQRTNSRSSQTPAAPTSTQPPFQFGAPSPHGTPAYIGKSTLTQENLHIPARKKQKQTNNTPAPGQTTPGSNASPKVAKAVSPEIKREQAQFRPQAKPSLVCSEPECDRHNIGFDSQEALTAHTQDEHIRPLENPTKYARENLASMTGLDSQGKPKKPVVPASQDGVKMAATASKQGQTPNIKGETTPASTPMNRQASMNRQGSAAGVKSRSTPSKDASTKGQIGQRDAKQASQLPQEPALDPWAIATIDPHDLFQAFQPFETGSGGAISDMNVYRSISPNDTPESSTSKDGVSEPNSDISDGVALDISLDIFDDNWMPFGPSETDAYYDMNTMAVNEEDLKMFDDDQAIPNYKSWNDMVDPSSFDKPFTLDTSLFSMDAE